MRYALDPMMDYMYNEIEGAIMHRQTATLHANATLGAVGQAKPVRGSWPLFVAAEGSNDRECMQALEQNHAPPS